MNVADRETPVTAAHTLVDEHGRHVVFANVAECIEREHAALREALKLALEYWAHRQQRYKNRSPVWVQDARAILAATEPK